MRAWVLLPAARASLAAVEACSREKEARVPSVLSDHAAQLATDWAHRYGTPRTEQRSGWLWTSSVVVGHEMIEPPLPFLLHQLYLLSASPADVRDGADMDAAHVARLKLLTAPAEAAAAQSAPTADAGDDCLEQAIEGIAALSAGGGGEANGEAVASLGAAWCASLGIVVA